MISAGRTFQKSGRGLSPGTSNGLKRVGCIPFVVLHPANAAASESEPRKPFLDVSIVYFLSVNTPDWGMTFSVSL